jgi:hypothetical protein
MSEQQKALTVVERATLALGAQGYEKDLAELASQSVSLTVITNADGYEQVHAARMRLKTARVEIEKRGKAAREDATAFSKAVIGEERRLIAIISPEEDRLQALQKAHDDAKEAEREAKIRAEQERVEKIRARIEHIRSLATTATLFTSAKIIGQLSALALVVVDDSYAEFKDEALRVLAETGSTLSQLHKASEEREAEQAKVAAERAELARLLAEQDARDKEARELREADERAERERMAEERRKLDAERAELERLRAATVATPATPAPSATHEPPATAATPRQPKPTEIINLVATHFDVDPAVAVRWLRGMFGAREQAA